MTTGDPDSLEAMLVAAWQDYEPWFKARKDQQRWTEDQRQWSDANQKVVLPLDQNLYQHIMHTYHDGLGAHPR